MANRGAESKIHKAPGSRSKRIPGVYQPRYTARRQGHPYITWGVFDDRVFVEGGFKTESEAKRCAQRFNEEFEDLLRSYSGTLRR